MGWEDQYAPTTSVELGEQLHPALFGDVRLERHRASTKHGRNQTPASGELSDDECLRILVEEVGEVARAMTYDEGNEDNLEAELTQVATMALAWRNGRRIKRERASRTPVDPATARSPLCDGAPCPTHNAGYATNEAPPLHVFEQLRHDTGEFPAVQGP